MLTLWVICHCPQNKYQYFFKGLEEEPYLHLQRNTKSQLMMAALLCPFISKTTRIQQQLGPIERMHECLFLLIGYMIKIFEDPSTLLSAFHIQRMI